MYMNEDYDLFQWDSYTYMYVCILLAVRHLKVFFFYFPLLQFHSEDEGSDSDYHPGGGSRRRKGRGKPRAWRK